MSEKLSERFAAIMADSKIPFIKNETGFDYADLCSNNADAILSALRLAEQPPIDGAEYKLTADEQSDALRAAGRKFAMGDRVTKLRGSKWTGHVVGFYETSLTPLGYAVESETEVGSVQIYPEHALDAIRKTKEG